ncbi:hypothetical protein [Rhodopila sp.]|uniref:hypothetical protein n=1 Tax=Rhodopila sp. TaxID=2480087 RepID=UPI003D0A7B59
MNTEQIKILATALNNVGVGSILAGIIAPTVAGTVGDPVHIMLWIGCGISFISLAYGLLGRLP